MSREIKVRGRHIHVCEKNEHLDGTWIYGFLADENYINSPELEGEFLVKKETVGQYVDILDKNKEEIYEGDIVSIAGEEGCFVVDWDRDAARFVMSNETLTVSFDNYWGHHIEVMGNVYDNTELLKKIFTRGL